MRNKKMNIDHFNFDDRKCGKLFLWETYYKAN